MDINLFVPNTPFLYPLKTSVNYKVFWCFQGVEKEWIGNKWVKTLSYRKDAALKIYWGVDFHLQKIYQAVP